MPSEIEKIRKHQLDTLLDELTKLKNQCNAALDKVNSLQTIANNLLDLSKEKVFDENGNPTEVLQEYILSTIQKQFATSSDIGNDIWLQPTSFAQSSIPQFLTIKQRKQQGSNTRFISFLNFKGGVGKTVLSSNLAAAFASGNFEANPTGAARPMRVLAVDLDFQGSLSDRCARAYELIDASKNGTDSSLLLFPPDLLPRISLDDITFPFIKCPNAYIIPTSDRLDSFDNKIFNYQIFKLHDRRFNYRNWFHNQDFVNKYDLVLFDCPPRKTASTVCALLASDYVFIPTAPETLDYNAVERTVRWLVLLKHNLLAHFLIGGVIFNRTFSEKKLTDDEILFKAKLEHRIKETLILLSKKGVDYPSDMIPKTLDSFVPKRSGRNSIVGIPGEALPGANRQNQFFTRLATEIYQGLYQ